MVVVLLNVVVGIGLSQSTLLSPVNLLTPLTAGAAVATSAAKPTPNYSNVCIFCELLTSLLYYEDVSWLVDGIIAALFTVFL